MVEVTDVKTYKTNDYSIFKSIMGNRTINLKNVNNIINNIKKNGLLPTVIIVNEKMEVIDGQHRLQALKELNLPVYYQIKEGLSINDCIAYNISSMKWTTLDYVESYAKIGYEDYQIILKLKDEFPWVTITTLISLAKCVGYTVNTSTEVQSGKFKLHCNVNSLINKLNLIEDVSQSIGRVAGYKVILYVVNGNLMDLNIIDEDRLKEQLIKYGSMIQTVTNTKDALEKIEEVYNYKKKQKVRFVSAYQERFED